MHCREILLVHHAGACDATHHERGVPQSASGQKYRMIPSLELLALSYEVDRDSEEALSNRSILHHDGSLHPAREVMQDKNES